ncbi:hypothetical protein L9F63_010264, partial [Diploptera punctata]
PQAFMASIDLKETLKYLLVTVLKSKTDHEMCYKKLTFQASRSISGHRKIT